MVDIVSSHEHDEDPDEPCGGCGYPLKDCVCREDRWDPVEDDADFDDYDDVTETDDPDADAGDPFVKQYRKWLSERVPPEQEDTDGNDETSDETTDDDLDSY